jgi:hypothetical protein
LILIGTEQRLSIVADTRAGIFASDLVETASINERGVVAFWYPREERQSGRQGLRPRIVDQYGANEVNRVENRPEPLGSLAHAEMRHRRDASQ